MYQAIVFLPLARLPDRRPVRHVARRQGVANTSPRGFLVIAALLSWVAFFTVGFGGRRGLHRAGAALHRVRRAAGRLGAAHRHADRGHAGGGQHRLGAGAHLFDRLHAPRSAPAALLRLSVAVHLRHADAGDVRQSRADVLRLGRRRPRLLSADRLLVQEAVGQRRGDQGLRRQPRRRFRLRARHFRRLRAVRLGQSRHDLRQCRVLHAGRRAWRAKPVQPPRPTAWRDGAELPRLRARQGSRR